MIFGSENKKFIYQFKAALFSCWFGQTQFWTNNMELMFSLKVALAFETLDCIVCMQTP